MLHRLKGSPLNTEFLYATNNLIDPLLSLRSPEFEEFKCATAKGRHASIMQKFQSHAARTDVLIRPLLLTYGDIITIGT